MDCATKEDRDWTECWACYCTSCRLGKARPNHQVATTKGHYTQCHLDIGLVLQGWLGHSKEAILVTLGIETDGVKGREVSLVKFNNGRGKWFWWLVSRWFKVAKSLGTCKSVCTCPRHKKNNTCIWYVRWIRKLILLSLNWSKQYYYQRYNDNKDCN